MSERLRTILAVAVLTVTIWVWADLEQTVPDQADVPVVITTPSQSTYVVRDISPRRVRVAFRGPSGQVADLKKSEKDLECRFALTDAQLKSGLLTLRAAEGFQQWAPYRVNVAEVQPAEIRVAVALQISLKVPVRVQVTGASLSEPAVALPILDWRSLWAGNATHHSSG